MKNYAFYQKKSFDDFKHSSQPYEKFEEFLFVFDRFSIEHLRHLRDVFFSRGLLVQDLIAENIWVQIWLIVAHMDLQPDNTYL